jgi:chemotaxis protein methyltransferase CheR
MYFAVEQIKKTVQKLHAALAEGGWLVVSPSDALDALFSPLVRENFTGAVFYQRRELAPPIPRAGAGNPLLRSPELQRRVEEVQKQYGASPADPSRSDLSSPPPAAPNAIRKRIQQPGAQSGARLRLYKKGNDGAAEKEALRLLALDSQTSQTTMLLARMYANQGKLAEARQWCERAIAADRMNPIVYYLLATIQQEQGALREAQMSLRQTLYLDPDFVLAHFALGYFALKQGKIAEASKCFANTRAILSAYGPEAHLPGSDGLTSRELMEIIGIAGQGR